jgi:ATP-dependent Clp protease ATP-binding subunit ClpX
MIPEFIGRLPVLFTLEALTEDMLVSILTQPKNAIVKQFRYLFNLDDVELDIEEDALREIAKKSIARKTGARGLRTILEDILKETMFDVPSDDTITKVIVSAKCVRGEEKPTIVRGEKHQAVPKKSEMPTKKRA